MEERRSFTYDGYPSIGGSAFLGFRPWGASCGFTEPQSFNTANNATKRVVRVKRGSPIKWADLSMNTKVALVYGSIFVVSCWVYLLSNLF